MPISRRLHQATVRRPGHVLHYLARYTHRVAICNHRLVSFADGKVTFRWRDSAHNNEQKLMTLSIGEFLRRFVLHLLPKGFVRIRNFGFLANRRRATLLPVAWLGTPDRARVRATAEIQPGVNQIVHQAGSEVESELPN